jgi:protein SCO1/2
MIYTTCEHAYPMLVSLMQHLAASLAPELRTYGQKMYLDVPSWTLLHGHPEAVLELAVLLGIRYKKNRQGDFAHANVITVLNKEGEIVHRHAGLKQNLAETLAAIRRAAQG